MLRSHFVIALRNMMRHKFYSFINILGLSFAIALVILVMLFVQSEFSKDTFHKNGDSIYRIYTEKINTESQEVLRVSATISVPLVENFKSEFDHITSFTRFGSSSCVVLKSNTPYKETIHFMDPDFFKMFTFPVIRGNSDSPISDLNDLVLSPKMATKYFGEEDPVGQILQINFNNKVKEFQVSAVVDPREVESSVTFDMVLHIEQYRDVIGDEMFNSKAYGLLNGFIFLPNSVSIDQMEEQLTSSYNRGDQEEGTLSRIYLQPLQSIYLDTYVPESMINIGNPQNSYVLMGLALLVLTIAVINFITLSTGHAINRVKEIGVRKAIGAIRGQLRSQLIVEAFFITLLSGFLGIFLAFLMLPFFNELAESSLNFQFKALEVAVFFGVILSISMLSGFLQSGLLVRIKSSEAVRGKIISIKGGKHILSKALIVLQFTLSIGLIVGTMVMGDQLNYLSEKDMGYDQERLVQFSADGPESEEASLKLLDRYKTAVQSNPNILGVSGTMNDARLPWMKLGFSQEDGTKEWVFCNPVDPDYLKTMKINLVLGNDFEEAGIDDFGSAILVNEALVKRFGLEDPLNAQIPGKDFTTSHRIIGVVEDFHFSNLKSKIEPLILCTDPGAIWSGVNGVSTYEWPPKLNHYVVRIGPGEIQPVIQFLEEAWKEVNPESPFLLKFVDDVLEDQYVSEARWGKIVDSASFIAILIAWLGLLGLTRLAVQKRIKEIGIRKVLGSSVQGVILLMARGIVLLIVLANVIAWPAAWLISADWLENFAYQIDLNVLTFLIVGLAVILLALGSVIIQVLGIATSNPVKSLRYE